MTDGPLPLAALRPGYKGEVVAMVVRKWMIFVGDGKYMGIDYILADISGNAIHCASRPDVAPVYDGILKVGRYFSFRTVEVMANLPQYRVLADPPFMLQIISSTTVAALDNMPTTVKCPYFKLTPLEKLWPDEKNTLRDVMGLVTDLKDITVRTKTDSNRLRKDTRTLDFYLQDNAGTKRRVTLWENKIEELLATRPTDDRKWVVVMVAMNPREYKRAVSLSSTSATQIYFQKDIPEISSFLDKISIEVENTPPEGNSTIVEIIAWCRMEKHSTKFRVKGSISDIDRRRGWFYLLCSTKNCTKVVVPHPQGYFCQLCNVKIENPIMKYRIRATVSDETGSCVFNLYENAADQLLEISAPALDKLNKAGGRVGGIPQPILDLINTAHVFEIPSNTYYEQEFLSFNCDLILSSVEKPTKMSSSSASPSSKTPRKREHLKFPSISDEEPCENSKKKGKMLDCLEEDGADEVESVQLSST